MDQSALAEVDFEAFKRKVRTAYNLDLSAYKRPQMERRLRANMDRCGAASFAQYYQLLQRDSKLLDEFLDRVTINVSEMFRNPDQFEILEKRVLPQLLTLGKGLSIWSAGCSCGAEAYTLAMILAEMAPGLRHTILATDIDQRMLQRAKEAVYRPDEVRAVTPRRLRSHFTSTDDGYKVLPEIARMVSFRQHNLLEDRYPTAVDLIVCRNVVIYFTEEAKSALYRRFFASLRPGGYLFVGGTERVADSAEIGYENDLSFFYRKPHKS